MDSNKIKSLKQGWLKQAIQDVKKSIAKRPKWARIGKSKFNGK